MALTPHYAQSDNAPAITGGGKGDLNCVCGQSVLISGYDPDNVLNVAIRCPACGQITETPGFASDAPLPRSVIVAERGQKNPSSVAAGATLISREELERLTALCHPRPATQHHIISEALLDDVERQQEFWTGAPLFHAARSWREHPLDWAVGYFRDRLKDPAWITFNADLDILALTVIAAFRDLIGSWGHHPQFRAMARTAGAQGFSFHALAMFSAAKALVTAGNRIGFVTTEGPDPRIVSLQVVTGSQEQLSVAVHRFDRFEWPNGANATPQALQAEVIEAMASIQGSINRLRPGILVLSGGASEGMFDQMLADSITAAIRSHGKRYRGLAAVAAIMPKVVLTGVPREARFGYSFYPVANGHHSVGQSVTIGQREG